MDKREYKLNAYYMIYLIKCVLHSKVPAKEKIEKMDLPQLFEAARSHSLSAIVAYALESAGISDDRFKEAKAKSIRKNALLDTERERIISEFERSKIWYMPLKGIILQKYYPRYGMRQMSDNDILFDAKYAKVMRVFMENSGYDVVSYGNHQDDIYHKKPVYNFELHRTLVGSIFEDLYTYYLDVEKRLIKDTDNRFGYHFSTEDFYIFIISHAYEHYKLGGTGLRTLIDIYLYNAKEKDMDVDYIQKELKKIRLIEFEKILREVSNKLFDSSTAKDFNHLSVKERKFLDYVIYSGTYGNHENHVKNQIEDLSSNGQVTKKAVIKYYFRRLFPELKWYKYHTPFIYKHKVLIPFYAVYRIIKTIPKAFRIKKEISIVSSLKNKRDAND